MRWLHSVCVVHGDLTGSNVLLDSAEKTTSDLRGFVAKVQCSWRRLRKLAAGPEHLHGRSTVSLLSGCMARAGYAAAAALCCCKPWPSAATCNAGSQCWHL